MNLRILCIALLSCIATTGYAEQYTYTFEGYFETKTEGSDSATHFPIGVGPGTQFSGWLVFDTNRGWVSEDGWWYPSPVRSLYIETPEGDSFVSTENFSAIGPGEFPGFDNVSFSAQARRGSDYLYSGGRAFRGYIGFSWASTERGQLPEESSDSAEPYLPHLLLRPKSWNMVVENTGECLRDCDKSRISRLVGHITRFGTTRRQSRVENFQTSPQSWTTSGGTWAAVDGSYTNGANAAFTTSVYTGIELNRRYDLDAMLYSQWSATGNTLGLLLHYSDSANYDEIRFSPTGVVTYSRVRNGSRQVLQTGQYPVAAPRTWFPVSVGRIDKWLSLRANGAPVFDVEIGDIRAGYSGLFASWNRARFDAFELTVDEPFYPSLHGFQESVGWSPVTGSWTLVDGAYYSSSNVAAAISTLDRLVYEEYTVSTSLLLDWSNSGNRGGLIYDYQDPLNYRAALVSVRTPQASEGFSSLQVIEVRSGVRRVVGEYVFQVVRPREWTSINVRRNGDLTWVDVGDRFILLNQPNVAGAKQVGLMTSYNKVRFDDVVVGVGY